MRHTNSDRMAMENPSLKRQRGIDKHGVGVFSRILAGDSGFYRSTVRAMSASRALVAVVALAVCLTLSPHARGESPAEWVDGELPELVKLYRHFHANPELSFQEEKTAARLAEELRKLGVEVTTGIGGHGLVGVLNNGDGPTVMLRCDLDALPIAEATGVEYASQVRVKTERGVTVGVMHACGHDVHITNLIGVARYLASHRDAWSGTLMLIGQPAEERGAGAKAMLSDGLFRKFSLPDYALALHVDPSLATGKVGYRSGYAMANVDSVDITIHGRGGHGAYPQTTIDPIVIAARLVVDLQSIVAREIKPIEPAVVTVGSIHGGTKHNIIGDSCKLQLTVRSYSDAVRKKLIAGIRRKALAAAASSDAPKPTIVVSEGTPSLWNEPELTNRMGEVFRRVLGKENVTSAEPSMGGEDFGRYGRAGVPILMFRLGAISAERIAKYEVVPSLHSATFYPDADATLRTGVIALASGAMELLQAKRLK